EADDIAVDILCHFFQVLEHTLVGDLVHLQAGDVNDHDVAGVDLVFDAGGVLEVGDGCNLHEQCRVGSPLFLVRCEVKFHIIVVRVRGSLAKKGVYDFNHKKTVLRNLFNSIYFETVLGPFMRKKWAKLPVSRTRKETVTDQISMFQISSPT